MIAYRWHTGKPKAKVKHEDPDRDQIRKSAFMTFYVDPKEPTPDPLKLAGLRWKLVEAERVAKRVVLVYRRIGKRPTCDEGG